MAAHLLPKQRARVRFPLGAPLTTIGLLVPTRPSRDIPRRSVVRWLALAPAALVLGCGDDDTPAGSSSPTATASPPSQAAAVTSTQPPVAPSTQAAAAATLAPTPACPPGSPTIAQTEGPFYTRNTPQRANLVEPGMGGTRMTLSGFVLTTDCRPVAGALLDFWQADDRGQYDNSGFRLRGHQFADAQGRYALETIQPALYTGRTRHIHVKVQAPGRSVLTTQLYFPNEPGNASDGIFNRALVMDIRQAGGGLAGAFNFVLMV